MYITVTVKDSRADLGVDSKIVQIRLTVKAVSTQWTNVLMQGHCIQNGYFGYFSGNLVSIQRSFYKLIAILQAWHRIFFKSIFKKLAKLNKVRLIS